MRAVVDLAHEEARAYFLKGSSYFNSDLPSYISFEPILDGVAQAIGEGSFEQYKSTDPARYAGVNYAFTSNKDGRLAWRPYELMHPLIYVSLVNLICTKAHWAELQERFRQQQAGIVECCSLPMVSGDQNSDTAAQISSWWQRVEQKSLANSLEFSHLLHTDVTDCYGSLYTHSIPWAIHGMQLAKQNRDRGALFGNGIDRHIQASRYGQTNGICQGSVLMDFVAEIVLGYVDELISQLLGARSDLRILRYRDDYRIFANSDEAAEAALRVVSDQLRTVGMRLGVSKTVASRNVVEGSIKPDKLAGISMEDLGTTNAKTIQKQLLRLHSFGQRYPNAGALRRLLADFHSSIFGQTEAPADLEVQVAIVTDIALTSPATIPAVAGILSHLISLAGAEKSKLWEQVHRKLKRVPYNGYLEIWLQRVTRPSPVAIPFESEEAICKIVAGEAQTLWESSWISSSQVKSALDVRKIVVADAAEVTEVVDPKEINLFRQIASAY